MIVQLFASKGETDEIDKLSTRWYEMVNNNDNYIFQ